MSHPNLIADPKDAFEFVHGGRAIFTLVSKATGNRKTYRVSRAKDNGPMFFISLLTGPDNRSDYEYIGYTVRRNNAAPRVLAGAKGNAAHPAFKALDWALVKLHAGVMPDSLEFWHEGRCACCGRALTDPASIERGVGPECAKKIG